MVSFVSRTTSQYFIIVWLTINIITLAANDDDYNECLRQVSKAFGYNSSATECYRFAVQYYTMREGIQIPDKGTLIPNQSQNVASSSQCVPNSVSSSSSRAPKPLVKVTSFEDLMSSEEKDHNGVYVDSNEVSMPNARAAEYTNFRNHDDVYVDSIDVSMPNVPAAENTNVINYAMLYYKELEKMAQAGGIPRPKDYCYRFFFEYNEICTNHLFMFGDTAKSAVHAALVLFKLSESRHNCYIYAYIEYIMNNVQIKTDYDECVRQVLAAYGNNDTSTGCYKHAIEHYVKGKTIPIPAKETIKPKETQSSTSSSQRVAKPWMKVFSFEDLMSSRDKGYDDNPKPINEHVNYTQYSDNGQQYVSNEKQNNSTEDSDVRNYANLYFEELEKMVQGNGIMRPSNFCENNFKGELYPCLDALVMFGSTPKMAAGAALTSYKLSECKHNRFIYRYMKHIIKGIKIKCPSKRPEKFCDEVTFHNKLH